MWFILPVDDGGKHSGSQLTLDDLFHRNFQIHDPNAKWISGQCLTKLTFLFQCVWLLLPHWDSCCFRMFFFALCLIDWTTLSPWWWHRAAEGLLFVHHDSVELERCLLSWHTALVPEQVAGTSSHVMRSRWRQSCGQESETTGMNLSFIQIHKQGKHAGRVRVFSLCINVDLTCVQHVKYAKGDFFYCV